MPFFPAITPAQVPKMGREPLSPQAKREVWARLKAGGVGGGVGAGRGGGGGGGAPGHGGEPLWGTGVPSVDEAGGGGLPRGALSEVVAGGPGGRGGQSFLLRLLEAAARALAYAALVDGAETFDPQSAPVGPLKHLLWVRCGGSPTRALQAADLLLRDENFALVAVDLRGCAERELRRIAATAWHRLQRVAEESGSIGVVFSTHAQVPSAALRLELTSRLTLNLLDATGDAVTHALGVHVLRRRGNFRDGQEARAG